MVLRYTKTSYEKNLKLSALTSLDKAMEIKPDYHKAWNNRGVVLGNLGRYEEAIAKVGGQG